MKRVLVTGGLGTIGRGLIEELRGKGHDVYSIDLGHGEEEIGFSLRTDVLDPRYARCDIGEFRQLERVFRKWGPFDYVYNCAAEFGRWNGEDFYEQLWRSNAVGTKNLIRLQEELKFRLIHFSSSEVYGDWPEIMTESVMDKYEIRQMNDYAMTKWVNEMQIHNSRQQFGTESVIVRIFNTYGPGEYYSPYRSVNCRFVYCALRGLPVGGVPGPLPHLDLPCRFRPHAGATSWSASCRARPTTSAVSSCTPSSSSPTWWSPRPARTRRWSSIATPRC